MIDPIKQCLVVGYASGVVLPISLTVRKHRLQVISDGGKLVQSTWIRWCLTLKSFENSLHATGWVLKVRDHSMHLTKLLYVRAEPRIEQLIRERGSPFHGRTRLWRISREGIVGSASPEDNHQQTEPISLIYSAFSPAKKVLG